jgi:hypothetical protein
LRSAFNAWRENASLRELAQALEPFGIKSLYKVRGNETDPNTPQESQARDWMNGLVEALFYSREDQVPATLPIPEGRTADSITQGTLYLNSRSDDFNRLYRDVLRLESPVWGYDPADCWEIRVPNFQAARMLSQMIVGDACLKFQKGDVEGAGRAAAANLRLVKNMGEQPILVSCMIHCAIECLLQRVLVRLPAEPDGLKNLASDVQTERERLRTAIQAGYYSELLWPDHAHFNPREILSLNTINSATGISPIRPLGEWLLGWCGRSWFKLQVAKVHQISAKEVEVTQRASELAASDLGTEEMNRDTSGVGVLIPNFQRAWLRINFMLLLREQTELIRLARTWMQSGKTGDLGDWSSVVIPGSKWEIKGEAGTNSVSLRLTPIPSWVSKKSVIDDSFFLLPLDGSKSWKFASPPKGTAAVAQ